MQGTHSAPPTGPSRQTAPAPLSLVKDAASDPHRANLAALLAGAVAVAAACHGCCLLPAAWGSRAVHDADAAAFKPLHFDVAFLSGEETISFCCRRRRRRTLMQQFAFG